MKEAMDIVRDKQEWRHRISTSSSPLGWRTSKKKNYFFQHGSINTLVW